MLSSDGYGPARAPYRDHRLGPCPTRPLGIAFPTFIWPLLGFVFLPWTTLMYVAVAPLGVTGLDWLWLGLALVVDIGSYSGGCVRESRAHPGLHHFDAATRAQLSTR